MEADLGVCNSKIQFWNKVDFSEERSRVSKFGINLMDMHSYEEIRKLIAKNKQIIGISGKARAGKDFTANLLVNKFGFMRIALADKLKAAAGEMFGWKKEHLYGSLKEQIDPFWGITPRRGCQLLGTKAGRDVFGEDIWIKRLTLFMHLSPQKQWVVPDIRFPNEAKFVQEVGGSLWRIERPGHESGLSEEAKADISEIALDNWSDWDELIVNNGSLQELEKKISAACSRETF